MRQCSLEKVAKVLSLNYKGEHVFVNNISTDSRNIGKDTLFVAIKGERFDGNDYVEQALANGAVAAIAEREISNEKPVLVVENSIEALAKIASEERNSYDRVIAITGSNGKTTVKEIVKSIVSESCRVVATEGNYNNEIGLPLTIISGGEEDSVLVLEMGARKPGDIKYLMQIARPDIVLINNVSDAHLETFGSRDKVAETKGEIITAAAADTSVVLNRDNEYYEYFAELAGKRPLFTFGSNEEADIINLSEKDEMVVPVPTGKVRAKLNLPGRHNLQNALAAITIATCLGIPVEKIVSGLEKITEVKGRVNRKRGVNGSCIIDDSYNANPASFSAAIDILKEESGKKWLLFGDMGELGTDEAKLHKKVLDKAVASKLDRIFVIGKNSIKAARENNENVTELSSKSAAVALFKEELQEDVTLLIKGSRFMGLDEIVTDLEVNG
ncbi:MAG: UDP-N-acetylmuramoyl-tripeptide--D-alanyl-D-alanine ligase [Gammaproteobacteria bacterium]|nr:MAG: UDP-N-acetylmuramoyl-tripeptide--D-alanyl-D-alanine ligase [Gammaproteobacteria bacterium]